MSAPDLIDCDLHLVEVLILSTVLIAVWKIRNVDIPYFRGLDTFARETSFSLMLFLPLEADSFLLK